MKRLSGLAVLLTSASLAAIPAQASAGVAAVVGVDPDYQLWFTAAPGERNDMSFAPDGSLVDRGAEITPAQGCERRTPDPHRVYCGHTVVQDLRLGDGNDRFDARPFTPPGTRVDAGPGDDILVGGNGDDILLGDVGADQISGGPGDDLLDGGGNSAVADGKRHPVPRTDRVDGGPGNDQLHGSAGSGLLIGGPGNDDLVSRDTPAVNYSPVIPLGKGDDVECGPGVDTSVADYGDYVAPDCEITDDGTPHWRPLWIPRNGRTDVRARCAWASSSPCRGHVELVTARKALPRTWSAAALATLVQPPTECSYSPSPRRLATATFSIRAGRVASVPIKLTRDAVHRIQRSGCLAVGWRFTFGKAHEATRYVSVRIGTDPAAPGLPRAP